jgi:ketosteroid isomerase-like protein
MRMKLISLPAMLAAALLAVSCEAPSSNNAGNKPMNTANNAAPAPAANPAAVESEIKKLVTDTAAALAKNDVAALDRLYADNYMLVNLDGSVQNKTDRLASIKSGDTKFDSFAYDEVSVRSNPEGTGAVSIARATASGMNKGKKVEGSIRVTQVWSKTASGWKQVSGHATQIASGSTASSSEASPSTNLAAPGSNKANSANENK